MNPKVKAAWLEALRSGKYKQGKGCLRDAGDRFCCLGVLCDLYGNETGVKWENHRFLDELFLPPTNVIKWAELEDRHPIVNGIGLATHNDDGARSFPEIADLIEKHL